MTKEARAYVLALNTLTSARYFEPRLYQRYEAATQAITAQLKREKLDVATIAERLKALGNTRL